FQLAFTLGAADSPETVTALARIARHDAGDPWTQTAVLNSIHSSGVALLETLVRDEGFLKDITESRLQLLSRLASLVAAMAGDVELGRALSLMGAKVKKVAPWQPAVLDGLGQGLQNSSRSLEQLWEKPPPALKEAIAGVRPLFEQAAATSGD